MKGLGNEERKRDPMKKKYICIVKTQARKKYTVSMQKAQKEKNRIEKLPYHYILHFFEISV